MDVKDKALNELFREARNPGPAEKFLSKPEMLLSNLSNYNCNFKHFQKLF